MRCLLFFLAAVLLLVPSVSQAWTAYNDLAWSNGQQSVNITFYTQGQSGPLIDYATGQTTDVTLAVSAGSYAPRPNVGANAAQDTDAYGVFNGIVDCTGVVSARGTGIYFTVTGLDTNQEHEIVLFGNRALGSSRWTDLLLQDMDSFANDSSRSGCATYGFPSDPLTILQTGENTAGGCIARYTDIRPGADGDFELFLWPDALTQYANALMVRTLDLPAAVGFDGPSSSGNENNSPVDCLVTLAPASTETATVAYAATGGTATGNGTDYTLQGTTLTFQPGETNKYVSLTIEDDNDYEDCETIQLTLSAPTNAALGTITNHVYTIVDNDPPEPIEKIAKGTTWRYRKGTDEASAPATAWRAIDFDDGSWDIGAAPFGYGDGPYGVTLSDMRSNYASVFLRNTFEIESPAAVSELTLSMTYDDGLIIWVNGEETTRLNMPGQPGTFNAHDTCAGSSIGAPADHTNVLREAHLPELRAGTNVIGLQVFNASPADSNLTIDAAVSVLLGDMSAVEDRDRDAMPDAWEEAQLGNTNETANADSDNDGDANIKEFVAGTDPGTNAGSFSVSISRSASNEVTASFTTVEAAGPGYDGYTRHYALEQRHDLRGAEAGVGESWTLVDGYTNILGTNQTVVYTVPAVETGAVSRVKVWLEQP